MIAGGLCHSFLLELLNGVHNFSGDEFKLALYSPAAELSPETTVYAATNEVAGNGYAAGGASLVSAAGFPQVMDGVAVMSWEDHTFEYADITAQGALIYNATQGNRAIMVIDFGQPLTVYFGAFVVKMPASTPTNAALRIIGGSG